jgi:hypothetical protein
MKKVILLVIAIILITASQAIAQYKYRGSGNGVITSTDCSTYTAIGQLCQDTDDGILYKGTGSAVEVVYSSTSALSADIQTLLGSDSYATARTNLGLAIGTNVQEYNQYYMKKAAAAFTEGHLVKTDANGDLVSAGAPVTQLTKTIYLPVAYAEDGAAPPAASSVLASTRKVKVRNFDGTSNENLEISFTAPMDFKASGTIKFRFIGYVTNATAPADTEVVAFSLAGCSIGDSDALGCGAGTAQTSALTVAGSGYAQYDRLAGAWSSAITITDLAASETVQVILIRLAESTDTYAQDFGLAGIEIKYIADIKTEASY